MGYIISFLSRGGENAARYTCMYAFIHTVAMRKRKGDAMLLLKFKKDVIKLFNKFLSPLLFLEVQHHLLL